MPRSRSAIPDVMNPTGRTDRAKGAEYRCTECGARRWAQAWKHYPEHCPEADDD